MKKVLKFVKGKKDERRDNGGGITPSQSGDLLSPAQTPEDERFLGLDNSFGYVVDFSGKDKSLTKLHKAAWQGNLEKLKSALKKIEIDAADKRNRTALHFAVVQGHPNIVWFLLGNNASTSVCDDEGCTPLLKAVECGHKECLKLFLERGADVDATDYTGNTGLHVAVKQGSQDIVSALLSKRANTEVSNNAGDYPLHIATKSDKKDLVDLLLRSGADVNVVDRENRTPLMLAAKNGNLLLADVFVESGAQLTAVDSNGWTADDYALLGGHETVASALKAKIREANDKSKTGANVRRTNSSASTNGDKSNGSWSNSSESSSLDKTNGVAKKLKEFFKNCQEDGSTEKTTDKVEDIPESPNTEEMPPLCQPPRSWDMIQAGMIDGSKPGTETRAKRLSLTTLGTLHSRRESFTEGAGTTSPKYTLSLNRRRGAKDSNNSFAKQRLSFNEEIPSNNKIVAELTKKVQLDVADNAQVPSSSARSPPRRTETVRDADVSNGSTTRTNESDADTSDWDSTEKDGTLGRSDTLRETEEIWVSSAKEANFPPPPSALELGVDMARSLKYMKGVSVDHPEGSATERNLWRNAYETHSLDCLEEKIDTGRTETDAGYFGRQHSTSSLRWKSQEIPRCQKSTDKLVDVNKRINEQLECYDQALRELAETSGSKTSLTTAKNSVNYYSLPSSKLKSVNGGTGQRETLPKFGSVGKFLDTGPSSAPPESTTAVGGTHNCENNEKLGLETPETKKPTEDVEAKRTRRQILMAMRDVKHAVHASTAFGTSVDDEILSPLAKPEGDSFDLEETSGRSSPRNEMAFFALGRQETVLERRKSSSSGTGDEPTLWLQSTGQGKANGSDEDVSEISDVRSHKRTSSFSPLGVLYREMQNEDPPSLRTTQADEISELRGSFLERYRGEEDESREVPRDPSPDISLSSGPIEPLGTEKDSGSDPESNDNDVTPTHHYTLKDQQEWLKSHLKTATTEKNRLEEIAAQLMEKAERLQYELADAKEATKSRDEVIKLLQEQLARMETAYTKSLEESVQSRLQLTSHEQEILHLKEICYRYEEEKSREDAETEANNLDKLESKIKRLEGEKEKMKEEIVQLESEKTSLTKRLKEITETEIIDQCQRWKERYDRGAHASQNGCQTNGKNVAEREKMLIERNSDLEKKMTKLTEENAELSSRLQRLLGQMESDKKIMNVKKEMTESVSELLRKNLEMEASVKNLEKDMEENKATNAREKEKELDALMKEFAREKNDLVNFYESKLLERKTAECQQIEDARKNETDKLQEILRKLEHQVENLEVKFSNETVRDVLKAELSDLKDQCALASRSLAEIQCRDHEDVGFLLQENVGLKKAISEIKINLSRDESRAVDFKEKYVDLACENVKMKNVIFDLKNEVRTLTVLLNGDRSGVVPREPTSQQPKNKTKQRTEDDEDAKTAGKKSERRNDHTAWSNLYGIKGIEKTRCWKSERIEQFDPEKILGQNGENGRSTVAPTGGPSVEKLELLKLRREISFLQNKMSDEKAMREALEKQINDISREVREKEILQQEVQLLKRRINRDYVHKLDLELMEHQKEVQGMRERYLAEPDVPVGTTCDDYRERCEILAKEREKSKEIRDKILNRANPATPQECWTPSGCRPESETLLQPQFLAVHPATLEPELKRHLEKELERSIRKYKAGTTPPPSPTTTSGLGGKTST